MRGKILFLLLLWQVNLVDSSFRMSMAREILRRARLQSVPRKLKIGVVAFAAVTLLHLKRDQLIDFIVDSGRKCGPEIFVGPGPY